MTATFGKLEHETLHLAPGLNVIEAPNEWGKSTWCAFLAAMLYGLDTRAKSTKTALADKEKFAPWSGSPMSGTVELEWNGKNITIERSSRGRIPMGKFRAYETETGLDIPELSAANCGIMLLGVEQSVFRRAGFIRQADMPVTQDEALRRRLQALVTTGDESEESDRLEQALRDLKNRCRYHKTGLIPQAERQRQELTDKLTELDHLQHHSERIKILLKENNGTLEKLENHLDALRYAQAEVDAQRIAQAREQQDQARRAMQAAEQACSGLPSREEAEKNYRQLEEFCENWSSAHIEEALMPELPKEPVPPPPFQGQTIQQAEEMLEQDLNRYALLGKTRVWVIYMVLGGILFLSGGGAVFFQRFWPAGLASVAGLVLLALGIARKITQSREARALALKYGLANSEEWTGLLTAYRQAQQLYEKKLAQYQAARADMDIRMTFLKRQQLLLCGQQTPENAKAFWQQACRLRQAQEESVREFLRSEAHLQTLQSVVRPAKKPAMEDALTCSEPETRLRIQEMEASRQGLLDRLGQCKGKMEAMGNETQLRQELDVVLQRLEKLEAIYEAAVLALETLEQARLELQRRFAPRIARRSRELLGQMTAGRYDRLALDRDLSLQAGAGQEDILRDVLWRSDGTVDQLYVALRLAVAEELMPQAPLILDDAFVRFDDERLKAVLHILKEQAQDKQILLFTCQSREKSMLG